jgi:hypothetical protein
MALVKFSVAFGFELRINPKIEGTIKTYYTMRNTHQKEETDATANQNNMQWEG